VTAAAGVERWSAHPWRARLLRLLVYAVPVAGSLVFVQAVTSVFGTPTSSLTAYLLWWVGMSLAATGVVAGLFGLSSRLLPLGTLLQLSLVFPDEAPSRFRLALRSGTVEELEERLHLIREARRATDPQIAAELLLQLVAALDRHDHITRGHAERVRAYAASLGKQIGLGADDLDRLNWAALLHDIGKLDVSSEILNKPGRPTDEEWQALRNHPRYGETLIAPLREWLGAWADAVGYHHEHWDGTGYPRAVAGEDIPLAGRIVAIADVYDVITSARSYKEPASPPVAREELVRCSGTQFDPRLVRAFVNISLGRKRLVAGPVSWLTNSPFLLRLPLTPSISAALSGAAVLSGAAATGVVAPPAAAQAPTPKVAHVRLAAPRHVTARPVARRPVRHAARVRSGAPHDPAFSRLPALHHARTHATSVPVSRTSSLPTTTTTTATTTTATTTTDPTTTSSSPPPAAPAPKPPPPPTTTTAPSAPPPPTTTNAAPPPAQTIPSPNQAPSFVSGANQSVLEDAGPQSVAWATAISPGPGSESAQAVTFSASADTSSLFSSQPSISSSGTLTYTPAPDANGTATVTVVAHDNGGTANGGSDTSAAHTFVITVTAVNDAPSFTPGANQTVVSLLGSVSVSHWATGITCGPADEAGQSVSFVVSVDKPNLFAVAPAISPDGTLTFKTKALTLGTTTVTVHAEDNGGTANGGVNATAVRTFTITIV
jgi:hypothetical protein